VRTSSGHTKCARGQDDETQSVLDCSAEGIRRFASVRLKLARLHGEKSKSVSASSSPMTCVQGASRTAKVNHQIGPLHWLALWRFSGTQTRATKQGLGLHLRRYHTRLCDMQACIHSMYSCALHLWLLVPLSLQFFASKQFNMDVVRTIDSDKGLANNTPTAPVNPAGVVKPVQSAWRPLMHESEWFCLCFPCASAQLQR